MTMEMSGTTWLHRVGERTLDLLFPPICVSCQADLDGEELELSLCQTCYKQIQKQTVTWPTCRRCGSRVPEIPGPVSECGRCQDDKLRFDRTLSLGSYEGLLGELVVRMKRDRSERLARLFSSLLLAEQGAQLRALRFDAIVPIPMPPWRKWTRGTNSPAAIADQLSRDLGLRSLPRALRRRRNSSPQKGLSRPGRFRNMHRQIEARAGYPIKATHVLLVDDVLTTGATCSEAARALKLEGAAEVSVLVVGRTPSN